MGAVVLGTYRELFAAIAATAGALTGLLFVAISVAPRRDPVSGPPVIQEIRAAAALLAFTSALAVSLLGLVPDTNVGYPAAVLGVIGVLFTAAGMRSILTSPSTLRRQRWQQVWLIALLLLIFGTGLVSGIAVLAGPRRGTPVQLIVYALVTSLLVWESRGRGNSSVIGTRGLSPRLPCLPATSLVRQIRSGLLLPRPPAPLKLATPLDPNLSRRVRVAFGGQAAGT